MKNLILILTIFLFIVSLGCRDSNDSNPISPDTNDTKGNTQKLPTEEDDDDNIQPRPEVDNPGPIEEKVDLLDKDWNDLTANQQYALLVLGPGTRVVVKNTPPEHGLHVRLPAGVNQGEANIIGHILNRSTGTIQSESKIVDNLIWFKIEWDKDAAGRCILNDENVCVGWSAAVSPNNTRLLSEIGN